ncbi:DUF924 family protein [Pelagibius sp. CAU 1746]|uniref:DUF924 family protein n=1 Tax=Pelagibius sp. CAU 1746 TaxID=3140370 RepID=UPI00325AD1D6
MSALEEVLEFWFAESRKAQWFAVSEAFDGECRRVLGPHLQAALAGRYEDWRRTPRGCLALVLLLDQAPRNLYRGTPKAFACDAAARAVTRHALKMDFDRSLSDVERVFLYLPLEHSEDLKDQQDCVRLIARLEDGGEFLSYAERHREIIARFGRFPHRNGILGRESTQAEMEFLKEPNSSF